MSWGDSFSMAWPWVALLWPLPWFVRRFLSGTSEPIQAISVPFGVEASGGSPGGRWRRLRAGGAWLCWTLLVFAGTHPLWAGDPVEVPRSGRNLMLAVDLSGSMKEQDLQLSGHPATRLAVVKSVLNPFIGRRQGDRLGLILFGDEAYLQTPLTFDRATVSQMLQEAVIGLAGESTAIGSAIGLAVRHLRDLPEAQRVLILLTDGQNTAGELSPQDALKLAVETGVRIHAIGVGADEMLIRTLFGTRRVNPSAELDEGLLRSFAEQTGGRYFRARDTQELESIYEELDRIEPVEQSKETYRPITPLFPWPLGAAVVLSLLMALGPPGAKFWSRIRPSGGAT